jgi:parallel beta-helix repeat protein
VVTGNTVTGNQNVGIAAAAESDANLQNNQIKVNTISNNGFSGIDIRRASKTTVEENQVNGNGVNGIYLTDNANQNLVRRNTVIGNTEAGVRVSGAQSFGNTLSQNSITGNLKTGIDVSDNANADIPPALSVQVNERTVSGTAKPNSTLEIFTDDNSQGQYYQGTTTTAADGTFSFFTFRHWFGKQITTVVTDAQGNSSAYSTPITAPTITDLYFTYLPVVKK